MRHQSQPEPMRTKSQVFARHLQSYLHETSMTLGVFATTVREHYQRSYAPHDQVVEWSHHPDVAERPRLDGEILSRWLNGVIVKKQVSIDLEDSLVAAFPPDRRFRLQIELAARQGMITFPMSSGDASVDALFLGRIAKEVGDVLISGAELLEDGVIDGRDRAKVPEFLVQVDEAIAVLFAVKEHASMAALGRSAVIDLITKAHAR